MLFCSNLFCCEAAFLFPFAVHNRFCISVYFVLCYNVTSFESERNFIMQISEWIMLATIVLYMAMMLAIGVAVSKKNKTAGDFFLGGR